MVCRSRSTISRWSAFAALGVLMLFALPAASALETRDAGSPESRAYTAQSKPRIAIMDFTDTNAVADSERYGPSVSAMLVTFFKRQSQFIVVERQDVKVLVDEWELDQQGATTLLSTAERQALFEKIDVILQGKVTLLTATSLRHKIEIDAKLLSVEDGRIVTAARENGSLFCLREIVDRLGSNLEHDFLRPYYGRLSISYEQPENTHLYLTPVLRADALEEEKPPIERGSTLYTHPDRRTGVQDEIEEWVTRPTGYTIENFLSGWYTLRLERPGYRGRRLEDVELRAVPTRDGFRIDYRRGSGLRWANVDLAPPELLLDKLLVHVPRLATRAIQIVDLELEKTIGSRQILAFDESGNPLRDGRVLLRSLDLDINPNRPGHPDEDPSIFHRSGRGLGERSGSPAPGDAPAEPRTVGGEGSRETCDFTDTKPILWADAGGRVVHAHERFDLESFRGGHLALESYRGEPLPTGRYQAVVWSPHFVPRTVEIRIRSGDGTESAPLQARLQRQRRKIHIVGSLERPVQLVGELTAWRHTLDLEGRTRRSATSPTVQAWLPFFLPLAPTSDPSIELPIDRYRVRADLGPFGLWTHVLDLLPETTEPLSLEEAFPRPGDEKGPDRELPPVPLKLKDGVWSGGRDLLPFRESFHDDRIAELLDPLLEGSPADRKLRVLRGETDLLDELRSRLEEIDLLVLSGNDTERLKRQPDVQEVIRELISRGHAALVFITAPGSYGDLLGAPLEIRKVRRSKKLTLFPGRVRDFRIQERLRLRTPRPVPRVEHDKQHVSGWRVLAFERNGKRPKILERGVSECGGYVLVWLEDSGIRSPLEAASSAKVEYLENRKAAKKLSVKTSRRVAAEVSKIRDAISLVTAKVGDRAIECATRLMYQRLGADDELIESLCSTLPSPSPARRAVTTPCASGPSGKTFESGRR